MRRMLAIAASLTVTLMACSDLPEPTAPSSAPAFSRAAGQAGGAIPGQYIVVLRDGADGPRALGQQLVAAHGGELGYVYEHALRGFSARLSAQAAAALERNPHVLYVEQDQVMQTAATQSNATWGLDRIDQRDLPLNGTYVYDQAGSGVNAYIIDTGIRTSHSEFTGRIIGGYDAITSGGSAEDCHGHGTHVAGTVGGTVYGVAKAVKLSPVRVLNCQGSGTTSGVIAGVDWVRANHKKPAVANMSLGGGASTSLDNAVINAINAGVTFVIAAGNSNANACNYSPARVGPALTVGATTSTDARASYSNFGSCLDLFAPGSSVTSAWYTSNTATNTISGTSMAAPHVAGVVALYLQTNPTAGTSTIASAIVNNATMGKVTSPGSGSPNRLLYSRFGATEPPPPPPPPPPAGISLQASGYKVQGLQKADLTWSGAAGSTVDVFRNNAKIATVANSGASTDHINARGGGTYTYRLCEAGTSTCSPNVTVSF